MHYLTTRPLRAPAFPRLLAAATVAVAAFAAALGWQAISASPGGAPLLDSPPVEDDLRIGPLTGRVLAWDRGQLRPVQGATVTTGIDVTETGADGSFSFSAVPEDSEISVITPGYDIASRTARSGAFAVVLEPVTVRAVFVPFHNVGDPSVQSWVHDLIDEGLINSVVLDIKDERGRVIDLAATETAVRIGASVDMGGLEEFISELQAKDVYTIGRIVTFMDAWYSSSVTEDALHFTDGRLFRDPGNSSWSSPFSPRARQYNIDIAVAAAEYFDEVQFDYVRLPYEHGLLEREIFGPRGRIEAITTFVRDASEALHLAGAAISADLFGVISVRPGDEGIGQSLSHLSPFLDYVSPMLYPSGWGPGWFGLSYPPANPRKVIRDSVDLTADVVAQLSRAHIRPWLQDFTDYQHRGLYYGSDQVVEQIEAAADAGANGFMLWDANLDYEEQALAETAQLAWSPRAGNR